MSVSLTSVRLICCPVQQTFALAWPVSCSLVHSPFHWSVNTHLIGLSQLVGGSPVGSPSGCVTPVGRGRLGVRCTNRGFAPRETV
ncbi:hypothetical protein LSAT2_010101 [Lamellibrachia satsuma]|nr:hypothetical protein LSAT2_010101 [Lamellibrachia satsuma]